MMRETEPGASPHARASASLISRTTFARARDRRAAVVEHDREVSIVSSSSATAGCTNMPPRRHVERVVLTAPLHRAERDRHSTGNRRVARGGGGLIVTFASRAAVSSAVS